MVQREPVTTLDLLWFATLRNVHLILWPCITKPTKSHMYHKASSRGAYGHDPFWSVFEEHWLDSTTTDITMALFILQIMSLYYLILWNQVDILQKRLKKDHVHMRLWTRLYNSPCNFVVWIKIGDLGQHGWFLVFGIFCMCNPSSTWSYTKVWNQS